MPRAHIKPAVLLCFFLLLLSFWSCQKQCAAAQHEAAAPKGRKNYEQEMIRLANELNKKIVPQQKEKYGEWEVRFRNAIGGPGNRLTLVVQIENLDVSPLSPDEIKQYVSKSDMNHICSQDAFKLLLQHEIILTMKFVGKQGKTIGDLHITRNDCGL